MRIDDSGSRLHGMKVEVQGVPLMGLIDTRADITIIGLEAFKKVAAVAHLKKRNFKKPDKVPYSFDKKPFRLDGMMNLDISFNGVTLNTPVYIKVDIKDQLLLSEGVCRRRQLNIVQYHSQVEEWRSRQVSRKPVVAL